MAYLKVYYYPKMANAPGYVGDSVFPILNASVGLSNCNGYAGTLLYLALFILLLLFTI